MFEKKIHALQVAQLVHDKKYHADILCLPTQRRANHMALHFSKYAGSFVISKLEKDQELLKKTLIDTFIIGLASANMFNIEISKLKTLSKVKTKDFKSVGTEVFRIFEYQHDEVYSFVADNVAISASRIAKAIESLDHLEPYPYRQEFEEHLERIIGVVFVAATFLDLDLIEKATNRIKGVEKKSIFYNDFSNPSMDETTY